MILLEEIFNGLGERENGIIGIGGGDCGGEFSEEDCGNGKGVIEDWFNCKLDGGEGEEGGVILNGIINGGGDNGWWLFLLMVMVLGSFCFSGCKIVLLMFCL